MKSTSFVLATLDGLHAKIDDTQSGDELKLALKAVQLDRSMAMRALLTDSLPVADLPACWVCDPGFWKGVLETCPGFCWDACPFANDINFAMAFETPDPGLARTLLGRFDSLRSDINFWRRLDFADFAEFEDLEGFVTAYAPREILEDKDIMLSAASVDYLVYDRLPVSLKNNRQMVEALVSTGSNQVLFLMSSGARMAFPDLTIKSLEMVSAEDLTEIFDYLEPNQWLNRDVARVWLSKGGAWLPDEFPDEFRGDSELMFLLAANDAEQFSVATQELRLNKDFVLRLLEKNGMVYRPVDDFLSN